MIAQIIKTKVTNTKFIEVFYEDVESELMTKTEAIEFANQLLKLAQEL